MSKFHQCLITFACVIMLSIYAYDRHERMLLKVRQDKAFEDCMIAHGYEGTDGECEDCYVLTHQTCGRDKFYI